MIIHLAAVIPPVLYRHPELARRVNVDATVALLRAAQSCPRPPRFIQASSNAVHGARNPHRHHELVREDSPARPSDLYGAHKAEVEQYVRSSGLQWVILRLGGVISVDRLVTADRQGLAGNIGHRRSGKCGRSVADVDGV